MIERMSITRRRILLAVLLVVGYLLPFAFIVPALLLGQELLDSLPAYVGVAMIVFVLVSPLIPLYFAGKAAAWAELPGGGWALLGAFWATGILLALSNLGHGLPDSLVHAVTLGLVQAGDDGALPSPGALRALGVSDSLTFGLPYATLWLMGSYTAAKNRRDRREAGAGKSPGEHRPPEDAPAGFRP